jgi:hypothetical protein
VGSTGLAERLGRLIAGSGESLERSGTSAERSGPAPEGSGPLIERSGRLIERSIGPAERSGEAIERSVDSTERSGTRFGAVITRDSWPARCFTSDHRLVRPPGPGFSAGAAEFSRRILK